MKRFSTIVTFGASLFAVTMFSSASSAKETLKLLYPWTSVMINSGIVDSIAENIKKFSDGELEAKIFDRSVVPTFKQMQPVAAGAFDINYTSPAFHTGATSVGILGNTFKVDPALVRSSGVFDLIDKHYQKTVGVKLLGYALTPGYQIILKKPVGPDGGLAGLKIRGNPGYAPMITGLGGTVVTLTAAEIYTGLQKNLIDGAAWVLHSLTSRKFYEVVKYMARPTFGSSTQVLVMNMAKYNKLSPKMKDAMAKVGMAFELAANKIVSDEVDKNTKGMLDKGVKFTQFGPKYSGRIEEIYATGIWQKAIDKHGAEAQAIVDLAKEKGLVLK